MPPESAGTVGDVDEDRTAAQPPEFGPSGYLPERAAKRARKIVLRAPLGAQWIAASLIAGIVVLAAGVLFLQRSSAAPDVPWVPTVPASAVAGSANHDDPPVLLVPGAGRIRAFRADGEVAYCPASNRLEATDGRVWSLTGRGLAGAASLQEHPVVVHDGVVYVDPTTVLPAPAASEDPAEPGCS